MVQPLLLCLNRYKRKVVESCLCCLATSFYSLNLVPGVYFSNTTFNYPPIQIFDQELSPNWRLVRHWGPTKETSGWRWQTVWRPGRRRLDKCLTNISCLSRFYNLKESSSWNRDSLLFYKWDWKSNRIVSKFNDNTVWNMLYHISTNDMSVYAFLQEMRF